jgi:hypothetical protein
LVGWLVASAYSSLMMEAVRTSETSVDNHFTRQYNPEDSSERLIGLHDIWYGGNAIEGRLDVIIFNPIASTVLNC